MYSRNLKSKLEEALKRSPVLLLTGARQTGKTTLMKEIGTEKGYNYVSFDQSAAIQAAQEDPEGFIGGLKKPVILDEVQRAIEFFLPIKADVDEQRIAGRYCLTGSANPLLLARIGDSLAGRMELYSLYPLSQGELINKKEDFIAAVFNEPILFFEGEGISREELCAKLATGGYPMAQGIGEKGRAHMFGSYITSILERDVRDISNIVAFRELENILELLAIRVANLHNISDISRSTNLPHTTLTRYIALLESLFLINFLPPWGKNLTDRLVRSPKVYLVDSGLLTYLLHINEKKMLMDPRQTGNIFENFVVSELIKQATWSEQSVRLFHFRSQKGAKVDIVLEDTMGTIVGIEVKYNDSITSSDFKGLHYLRELAGDKFLKGVVLYTGKTTIPFGKDLFALPIDSLWHLAGRNT